MIPPKIIIHTQLCLVLLLLWGNLDAQRMSARDFFIAGTAKYRCNACRPAIEDFTKALLLEPEYANAFLGRGLSHLCLKQYEEAVQDIKRAQILNDKEPLFVHGMGRVMQERGDLKGALIEFTKATELDRHCWQAWYSKGEVLVSMNQNLAAEIDLNEALSQNPNCGVCWLEKGKGMLNDDKFEDAIKFFTKALDKISNYAEIWFLRGKSYVGLNRYSESIQDFTRAIEIEPENSNYRVQRAKSQYFSGQVVNAMDDLNQSIRLDRKNGEAWLYKGKVTKAIGYPEKAISFYSHSIRVNPKMYQAYVERGETYLALLKPEKGLPDLNEAINLNPTDMPLRIRTGNILYGTRDFTAALAEFKYVLKKYPENMEALLGEGMSLMQLNRKPEACQSLKKAASLGNERAAGEVKSNCSGF